MYYLKEIVLYAIWIIDFQEIAVKQNALNSSTRLKNLIFIVMAKVTCDLLVSQSHYDEFS